MNGTTRPALTRARLTAAVEAVARQWAVAPGELLGVGRVGRTAPARGQLWALLYEETSATWAEVAEAASRHENTVASAARNANALMSRLTEPGAVARRRYAAAQRELATQRREPSEHVAALLKAAIDAVTDAVRCLQVDDESPHAVTRLSALRSVIVAERSSYIGSRDR